MPKQVVEIVQLIKRRKNLQFLDDITELGNLNGNGVSWREKNSHSGIYLDCW